MPSGSKMFCEQSNYCHSVFMETLAGNMGVMMYYLPDTRYCAETKLPESLVFTPSQYHAAMSKIEDFLARGFKNLNAKEANHLDELSDRVHEYESLKYPMPMANSVSGILQGYMATHNLNRTKLGTVLQVSGSTISDIFNGKKGISFPLAVKMYQILKINAEELLSVKIDSSSKARQGGIFQSQRVSSGRIKVSSKRRPVVKKSAAKKAARRK